MSACQNESYDLLNHSGSLITKLRKLFGTRTAIATMPLEHIKTILAEIDALLAGDRVSIPGGTTINYVDITFASLSGVWLQSLE